MAWFTTLPHESITNFHDFSSKFLVQFSASKIKQVTIDDLYNVRQLEGETLKQYVRRYNAASVKIEDSEPQACARAFKNGLQSGKLNSKLSRKRSRSMTEVRARANTYILDEEDDTFKRRRAKAEKDGGQNDISPTGRQSQEKGESSKRRDKKIKPSEKLVKEQLYPKKENLSAGARGNKLTLADERDQGNRYKGNRQQDDRRRDDRRWTRPADKEETWATRKKRAEEIFNKDLEPPVGTINTIAGGFSGGGDTQAARRGHVKAVSSVQDFSIPFGFQHPNIVISSADFEGFKTHKDDPVVVMVRINNFNMRRVLLDQGSSADIIYGDTFDQLGLTDQDLMPYSETLVGFSREQVWVRGHLDLDTVFGVNENAKLLRVRYLVLQVLASYNVIIGRNTRNRFCAVISTAHLAVKYPLTCGKVGKIEVDQRRARECYNNCLSLYGKKGAGAGHRCHEIEILEGNQGQQSIQGQGQGGAIRQGRWISERYGGPRRNPNQKRPDGRTGKDVQFTDAHSEERWENVIVNLKMYKVSRGVLVIEPRLTVDQERRLEKLVGDNFDLFNWSQKDAALWR
ncbi:uncharacterized protein LOC130719364 [Lotus japonicus]|uniref:uncharacterized protein LOC130719364 n=1 Tax=Lotus japonicus TaxID=34305 RepID=UPI00258A3DAA|nr:uncharacterized protein LOC130719364 [Lotus japonicus]